MDRTIPLPIRRPTCCVFGGPGRSTLFITTAAQKLTETERAEQPLAGKLLAIDGTGARGPVEPAYID
jgi:sugar lactone lactonase YvrE